MTEAPQRIRQHMLAGPGAAKLFAGQIKSAACKISDQLHTKTYNARKTGVTSDDMSQAMMPFLHEIEELRKLPGSTAIAFDLVMTLGAYSYGELDGGASGYDERPSDPEVDELLVDLALERKKIEPSWDTSRVLDTLQKQDKELDDFGIEGFCADTIELLSAWKEFLPVTEKLTSGQGDEEIPLPSQTLQKASGSLDSSISSTSIVSDEDGCSPSGSDDSSL